MTPLPKSVSTELRFPKVFMLMTYGAERITLSERSNLCYGQPYGNDPNPAIHRNGS